MKKGTLAHLAMPGAEIAVRAAPRASRDAIDSTSAPLRIWVTAPPEDGKANRAVKAVLADALGVAKSRLILVRGATSRDKVFRLD